MQDITKNVEWISSYKILIPKAWGSGNSKMDHLKPLIPKKYSCCTETYLVVGPLNSKNEVKNVASYIQTKFFHFMVSQVKNTQNTMKKAYKFVPIQNFTETWSDEKLYKKYKLSKEEIQFIETMVHSK